MFHSMKMISRIAGFAPALFLFATAAFAADGSCVAPKLAVPESDLDHYRADPANLLAPNGQNTGAVSSRIRNAVASAPGLITSLAGAMKTASGDQAVALGTGLGAAAQVCAQKAPAAAQSIQQSVADAKNADLSRAFAAVIGDLPVLSVAAGNEGAAEGSATPGAGTGRHLDTPEPRNSFRTSGLDEARTNLPVPSINTSGTTATTSAAVVNAALLSVSGSR